MSGYITIEYQNNDPNTYNGMILCMGLDTFPSRETFNTGNPTLDYLTCDFVVAYRIGSGYYPITNSSSIDQFIFDGGS